MTPKLSILIPSLISRHHFLTNMLSMLYTQHDSKRLSQIEILTNIDNAQKTIGQKRNELLASAKGDYVVFIDDDDEINPFYLTKVFEGIDKDVDHVGICGLYMPDNGPTELFKCSKDFRWEGHHGVHYRTVQHLCVIRRTIAQQFQYPLISHGEDKAYADLVTPHVKTEHLVDSPIYMYRFVSQKPKPQV